MGGSSPSPESLPDPMPLTLLTRDAILGASDLTHEDVHVPEWGGTVRVRALTASERDAFEASITEETGTSARIKRDNIRTKLVVRSVIDAETGARLFQDTDIEVLGTKAAAAVDRLFAVAQRLSGLSASDVEELAGNSAAAPAAASPSGSPATPAA